MTLRIMVLALLINSVFIKTEAAVKFFVYTARQTQLPLEVGLNDIGQIDFDQKKTFRLLSHGWMDTSNSFWIIPTKNNLISIQETNVISIDWKEDAGHLIYYKSAGKVKSVGEDVANWIINLSRTLDIPMDKFHLVGHSLGAHVFGFAAKSVFRQTNTRIGRITGLDPAGPTFNDKPPAERLDVTDADFVDVIHTSAVAGYKTELGHVDFWPNGGKKQSGCNSNGACNHNRAPIYYTESVISRNFSAWKCDSKEMFDKGQCSGNEKTVMGEQANKNARGSFYLNTNGKEPFGCNC